MSFNPSSNQNVEDYLLSIVILFVWNIYLTILYILLNFGIYINCSMLLYKYLLYYDNLCYQPDITKYWRFLYEQDQRSIDAIAMVLQWLLKTSVFLNVK